MYRSAERLTETYGRVPDSTVDPEAVWMDQTDIWRLQRSAADAGKKYIFLFVFDGMDWQTTQAAANYRAGRVAYVEGPGTGLQFQDYEGMPRDFGFMVTSPACDEARVDVETQTVVETDQRFGGYDADLGGRFPWSPEANLLYLIGRDPGLPHTVTDSSSSATSMTCGIKTYNGSVNVGTDGSRAVSVGRELQASGWGVGVVTSVPISHATPGAAYANNVSRDDYQDISRDLLGLPSAANHTPLPGVDVLIGCGWGVERTSENQVRAEQRAQGSNFVAGNRYLADDDLRTIDLANGGRYRVATRTTGSDGSDVLMSAARQAATEGTRLLGYFGTSDGHLPYRTANGDFQPSRGISGTEERDEADVHENPTLAEMTTAALTALEPRERFWMMVEAGDVDWANHDNNIDHSIGAVISGDEAFAAVCKWVEQRGCQDETLIIVTADHGHMLVVNKSEALLEAAPPGASPDPNDPPAHQR
jgi:alkaline phosphatase